MLPTDVPEDPPGLLVWFQGWYTAMCDGDWPYDTPGIEIRTIGNPGWRVSIPISFTGHPTDPFEPIEVERDEHDWIQVWVADGRFEIACGPTNLSEGLFTFREWITS